VLIKEHNLTILEKVVELRALRVTEPVDVKSDRTHPKRGLFEGSVAKLVLDRLTRLEPRMDPSMIAMYS
jgi:hypothetical protein